MSSEPAIVIGGGPVGSLAAREIALSGHEVVVLEEHPISGIPNHCSGLMSNKGIKRLSIGFPSQAVQNRITGARFFAPNGKDYLEIDRRRNEMTVFDRASLDQHVARLAEKAGARYLYNHSARLLKRKKKKIVVSGSLRGKRGKVSFQLESLMVISAEGREARLSQQLGLPTPDVNWHFPAIQYELDGVKDMDPSFVDLYFGKKWSPGFFGWAIPTGPETMRIGACRAMNVPVSTRALLDHLMKKHPWLAPKVKSARIVQVRGGIVVGSGPIKKTVLDNFLVTGDAAGQTKATTGGGFNLGGFCGRLAGKTAALALEQDDFSAKFLSRYEKEWKWRFGREFYMMRVLRRFLTRASDHVMNEGIKAAHAAQLDQLLEDVRDVDLHGSGLIRSGFKSRPLMFWGMKSLPLALRSLA